MTTKVPTSVPVSLLILRRRVLEEMRKPGADGQPRFQSGAQLARFLGVDPSHVSHFLKATQIGNVRGVSWEVVDKLAAVFDLQVWQLFYVDAPYEWRSKGTERV